MPEDLVRLRVCQAWNGLAMQQMIIAQLAIFLVVHEAGSNVQTRTTRMSGALECTCSRVQLTLSDRIVASKSFHMASITECAASSIRSGILRLPLSAHFLLNCAESRLAVAGIAGQEESHALAAASI